MVNLLARTLSTSVVSIFTLIGYMPSQFEKKRNVHAINIHQILCPYINANIRNSLDLGYSEDQTQFLITVSLSVGHLDTL